ncbi:molybdopterin-dependent oxidoreductase [Natrialbaceae archaeon A-chndr2]
MSESNAGEVALSRRSLLKVSGATLGAMSLGGCLGVLDDETDRDLDRLGDADVAYGNCWMCHHACGQEVAVNDGTIVDITGVDGHPRGSAGPGREGTLCPKGLAEMEKAHDPDRITQPYIREDGELRQADWDEAFEYAATRLKALDEQYGAETFLNAASWATTNLHGIVWGNLYGTPERIGRGRHVCFGGAHLSGNLMGVGTHMRFVDYQNADYIIAWGRNLFESFAGQWEPKGVLEALDNGAKLVVVDPQHTPTAQKADEWLPIEPRTDGALALAMGHVIVEENLYDEAFVEEWTYGFERYREEVADKTPEWASERTGLEPGVIRQIAVEFAEAAPAAGIALWTGVGQYAESQKASQAVFALNGLVGNIDRPGGLRFWRGPPFSNPFEVRGIDLPNNAAGKTPALRKYEEYEKYPFRHTTGIGHNQIPEMVENGHIRGMYCHYDNPLTDGNTQAWLEALEEMELIITVDAYWNELTRHADVVFPEAIQLEKDTLIDYAPAWSAYHENRWVSASKAAVEPQGNTKPGFDILKGIAEAMGWGEYVPWQSEAEYNEDMLANIDYSFEEVAQENYVILDEFGYEQWKDSGFSTATGRFQFYLDEEGGYRRSIEELDEQVPDVDLHTGPQWVPPGTFGDTPDGEYPLHFYDTRAVFFAFGADQVLDHPREQYARKHGLASEEYEGNYLVMNTADADERGIETGDMVTVATEKGDGEVMAYVSERTPPGFVTAEFGFGQGNSKEDGMNTMIVHDGQTDPISSQVDRHIAAEVRKTGGD